MAKSGEKEHMETKMVKLNGKSGKRGALAFHSVIDDTGKRRLPNKRKRHGQDR